METLRRSRDGREEASMLWPVLACIAVLAGLIGLVSSRPESFTSHCFSANRIVRQRSLDAATVVPSQIFRPSSNRMLTGKQPDAPHVLEHEGDVGSVSRLLHPSVESRLSVSVPQTIWQTARSRHGTPDRGIDLFNSWTTINPGWDHYFLDDEDDEAFVIAHYNKTVVQAFKDLPLGVMKADVIRYMIIHNYGGVYADMDTECRSPVEKWAPLGCQFSVATETGVHFSQWAFASVPGHGALGHVLELVLSRMIARVYKSYIEKGDWEFVHDVTGPAVFTEAMLDFLGVEREAGEVVKLYPLLYERRREFRDKLGVCLLTYHEMRDMLHNHYSSANDELQSGSWKSWTKARDEIMEGRDQPKAKAAGADGQGDGEEQKDEEQQKGEEQHNDGEEKINDEQQEDDEQQPDKEQLDGSDEKQEEAEQQ